MSKYPNPLWPMIGVTGVVLGLAYGVNTRSYKADEADLARLQAASALEKVEAQRAANAELAAEVNTLREDSAALLAQLEARPASHSLNEPAPLADTQYGLGRTALPEEIAAWDVDVLPDGRGLPEGSGDVSTGEEVFAAKCASCHGDFAEGVGNWPVLAGGFDTLANKDPVKTVGSYWPYLSTVWDYVHRSMPFGEAGTLSADETYAIVAYILYSNNLVEDDFELNQENFAAFEMYNAEGFVIDDRPEQEYAAWRTEPCMSACKESVDITMRSVFLVEEPPEGGSNSVMNPARRSPLPSFTAAGPSFIPEATSEPAQQAVQTASAAPVEADDANADLIAQGEKVFRKCKACHKIGDGAKNGSGPHLNGVIGRAIGSVEGFRYSGVFQTALNEGRVWDEAALAEFLSAPKSYMQGTKMSFAGLKSEEDVAAIMAYLKEFPTAE